MLIHSGPRIQHGRGFGSLISAGLRWLKPAATNAFKNVVKFANSPSGRKIKRTIIKRAKKGAINAINDKLSGKSVKASLKNEIDSAKKEINDILTKKQREQEGPKKRKIPRKRMALLD